MEPSACKEAGIHTQTYDRWRMEYGGLKLEQAKRLKGYCQVNRFEDLLSVLDTP